jgi:predicted ATPase/DNA-binding SARP family transcriptional activator
MEFRVLGALEVRRGDDPVAVGSRKERALLAALLVNANAVVPSDRLIDVLWGGESPPSDRNSLQTYVARLRRRLAVAGPGGAPILTRPPGYVLEVDANQVDALMFEALLGEALSVLSGDPSRALRLLDEALGLWRGPAFAEFADEALARAEAVRLEELKQTAMEGRVEALLALGRVVEAIAELEPAVAAQPLRERPHAQLMRALSRGGRQVDALRLYQRYRQRLGEELGLEPSAALCDLEADIIRQHPDVAASTSPALAGARRGNLPAPGTSFVGREHEMAELVAVLGRARVVTLVGPGGVGKTRLALQLAGVVAGDYADGTWLVELAPVGSPNAVVHVVGAALGLNPAPGRTLEEVLVDFLRGRRLLLVVDNCEHVLQAAALLVEKLARSCPGLTVLATSRERLAVDGEHTWPVPPLPVPPRAAGDVDAMADVPAVALFVDRACAARPDFRLDAPTAVAVAEICRSLDGLPLAIELAAARMGALTARDLADRLGERFPVLTSGRRSEAERHRTLRAVVDWSYGLLDEAERRLFERLSVFAGGWTLAEATAVCAGDALPRHGIVPLMASLVDKSMVVGPEPRGTGRYGLLETLRQYGAERLEARGEAEAIRRAHAQAFLGLVEEGSRGLQSVDEGAWVDRLNAEVDNLRAAHNWCRRIGDADLALRLSSGLHWFACSQMNDEIFTWAASTVELSSAAGHPLLPLVHGSAGVGACLRGDHAGAVEHAERGLAASAGPDDPGRRLPFDALGEVWGYNGRLDDAFVAYGEMVRLARAIGDLHAVAYGLVGQALARAYPGDLASALALGEEVRQEAASSRNPTAAAWSLYVNGETLLDHDPAEALRLLEESVKVAISVNNVFLHGVALLSVTSLQGRHGEPHEALRSYREVIEHWHRRGNWTQQWITLRNLVALFARIGADEAAAVLYGGAGASATAPTTFGPEAERLGAVAASLTARLGPQTFDRATRHGARLNDEETVAFATTAIGQILAGERPEGRPPPGRPTRHSVEPLRREHDDF